MKLTTDEAGLAALERGRAFVDLSAWRKVRVRGTDAAGWLHDLVTADVIGLGPGDARRSLLLTPTGKVRADLTVARRDGDFLLFQAPDQPDHIADLLSRYVLSSDVILEDITRLFSLIAVVGDVAAPTWTEGSRPSALGTGVDLTPATGAETRALVRDLLERGFVQASLEAADVWRVLRGTPRMGRDFDTSSLAAESGLDDTIDLTKGCFLGQESVARVRNLGHPPRVLRRVRATAPLATGESVLADGRSVGTLTSTGRSPRGEWLGLARIRWEAAAARLLSTQTGAQLDVL